jgi:hypothetical protein
MNKTLTTLAVCSFLATSASFAEEEVPTVEVFDARVYCRTDSRKP